MSLATISGLLLLLCVILAKKDAINFAKGQLHLTAIMYCKYAFA